MSKLQVRVAANVTSEGGKVFRIAKAFIHPGNNKLKNDVAILELSTPLKFSKGINKIDLPGTVELEPNTTVTVTGYGLSVSPRYRQRLQVLQIPIISREVCNKIFKDRISEDMICAGIEDKNVCYVSKKFYMYLLQKLMI